ncbi:hypothetical protein HY250_02975 [Candidatus Azambacteria bacterium]|nr:hypothetical protein [Candidatus Azambacteria bacterium]
MYENDFEDAAAEKVEEKKDPEAWDEEDEFNDIEKFEVEEDNEEEKDENY